MSRIPRRLFRSVAISAVAGLALAGLLMTPGCGEDPTGPTPTQVIVIRDTAFIPNSVRVKVGALIEWQNWSQETRTVTSGDSASAPDAGALFDESLAGYASGHAIGGTFRYTFVAPDTVTYFSRLVPGGFKGAFRGSIFIEP